MSRGRTLPVLIVVVLTLFTGCQPSPRPEDVALAYGRALYANDSDAIWRLASTTDRRAKDAATFREQQQIVDGFARFWPSSAVMSPPQRRYAVVLVDVGPPGGRQDIGADDR